MHDEDAQGAVMRRDVTIRITDMPDGVDEHDVRNELIIALGCRFAPTQIDVTFSYPDADPNGGPFDRPILTRYGT